MNRTACWLVFGLSLSLPTGLRAQACLGVPQGRQQQLTAYKSEPPNATQYGGKLLSAVGDHSYAGVQVGLTSYDRQSWSSSNDWDARLTVAHELRPLRATASVCPELGARYRLVGDQNVLSVPAGVAAGKTLGIATLYAFPHFLWVRDSRLDDWNTYAAMDYGLTLSLGKVVLGFSYSHLLERGAHTTSALGIGFAL